VFKAILKGEHEVAVKTMRVAKIDEDELAKFKAELIIMAPLHHPNLVRLFGGVWNEGADKLCIVLEFCANGSLKTFLTPKCPRFFVTSKIRRETVGTWESLRHGLALGTAKGLAYIHHELAEPLIHRDVDTNDEWVPNKRSAVRSTRTTINLEGGECIDVPHSALELLPFASTKYD
jgi:serine/threonine protein kinase